MLIYNNPFNIFLITLAWILFRNFALLTFLSLISATLFIYVTAFCQFQYYTSTYLHTFFCKMTDVVHQKIIMLIETILLNDDNVFDTMLWCSWWCWQVTDGDAGQSSAFQWRSSVFGCYSELVVASCWTRRLDSCPRASAYHTASSRYSQVELIVYCLRLGRTIRLQPGSLIRNLHASFIIQEHSIKVAVSRWW